MSSTGAAVPGKFLASFSENLSLKKLMVGASFKGGNVRGNSKWARRGKVTENNMTLLCDQLLAKSNASVTTFKPSKNDLERHFGEVRTCNSFDG